MGRIVGVERWTDARHGQIPRETQLAIVKRRRAPFAGAEIANEVTTDTGRRTRRISFRRDECELVIWLGVIEMNDFGYPIVRWTAVCK